MVFVPACMIASFQTTTWKELFEFSRRQFIITRVYLPLMWIFGLLNTALGVLILWGSPVVAMLAFRADWPCAWIYSAGAVLFWGLQIYRANSPAENHCDDAARTQRANEDGPLR